MYFPSKMFCFYNKIENDPVVKQLVAHVNYSKNFALQFESDQLSMYFFQC